MNARVYKREPAGTSKGGEFANDGDAQLKAYLVMVAGHKNNYRDRAGVAMVLRKINSTEAYVLANGRQFDAPLGLPKGIVKRKLGLCYMNAYQLADNDPRHTYVEGFASYKGIPMGHAWTVDAQNRVVDPTWAGRRDYKPSDYRYFGVKMNINDVRKTIVARGKYGVLHNPEQGFPLLK